jgi:TRAP-type mannitol/chloroaromatic compound transport system permease large subunit
MIMLILTGGSMFSSVFLGMGGGTATEKVLATLNLGPWGVLVLFLFIIYLAGFVLDWASILLVFVPIFSPIIDKLGFDPIWFGALFIMMIQTSYLTPPMAPAIFYLKGIAPPEITTNEIFKGIWIYMLLQLFGICIVTIFPQVALWLPSKMIGF